MPKTSNITEFIKKANEVHKNKYGYSNFVYINNKTKGSIDCPDHGSFFQLPASHLRQGCPKCAIENRTSNIAEFITKANEVHKNKYGYSNFVYINARTKGRIDCPNHEHGSFFQTPNSHLRQGCPKCAIENRTSNITEFIKKANKVHKKKYGYSDFVYINSATKGRIDCPNHEHGSFFQTPNNHVRQGCPKCAIENATSNITELIKKANKVHKKKYGYSDFVYINSATKGRIDCPDHGSFFQKPASHLRHGCPKCAIENATSNITEFIKKANEVHKKKYGYSNFVYISARTKGRIDCPNHGSFFQKPASHLRHGCPKCCNTVSKSETAWLNNLGIPNDKEHRQVTIKIGKKKYRVDGFDPKTNTVYEFDGDFFHGNQSLYKKEDINPVTKTTFGKLYEKTCNKHRQIKEAGYNLITIWESDWKKLICSQSCHLTADKAHAII